MQGLRGIREGRLDDLPPLAVLMGPNGCGKSSVLEALLLGASNDVGEAVGRCVQRRMEVPFGSSLLFTNRGDPPNRVARVELSGDSSNDAQTVQLRWSQGAADGSKGDEWVAHITGAVGPSIPPRRTSTQFTSHNAYQVVKVDDRIAQSPFGYVRFLDQRIGVPRSPLHKVYSDALNRGALAKVRDLARQLLPAMQDIQILTPNEQTPVLHIIYGDGAVPVALSGDGIESAVRLALEMAARSKGVFLIEEPEAHQHIAAMARSARVICAAVRQGAQVVLSTHSLEFLDLLIDEAGEGDLDKLGAYQLRLDDGELRSTRVAGQDVRFARSTIAQDLR